MNRYCGGVTPPPTVWQAIMSQYICMFSYYAYMTEKKISQHQCWLCISLETTVTEVHTENENEMKWISLFHCLQPSTLYSSINALNLAQAIWFVVFLHSSSKGLFSTQVFDSNRYCILQKGGESEKNENRSVWNVTS